MTYRCPYCREHMTQIQVPPMPPKQRAIYNAVVAAGSVGMHKDDIIAELAKLQLVVSPGKLRQEIHYMNNRHLIKISQWIGASRHSGIYILKEIYRGTAT